MAWAGSSWNGPGEFALPEETAVFRFRIPNGKKKQGYVELLGVVCHDYKLPVFSAAVGLCQLQLHIEAASEIDQFYCQVAGAQDDVIRSIRQGMQSFPDIDHSLMVCLGMVQERAGVGLASNSKGLLRGCALALALHSLIEQRSPRMLPGGDLFRWSEAVRHAPIIACPRQRSEPLPALLPVPRKIRQVLRNEQTRRARPQNTAAAAPSAAVDEELRWELQGKVADRLRSTAAPSEIDGLSTRVVKDLLQRPESTSIQDFAHLWQDLPLGEPVRAFAQWLVGVKADILAEPMKREDSFGLSSSVSYRQHDDRWTASSSRRSRSRTPRRGRADGDRPWSRGREVPKSPPPTRAALRARDSAMPEAPQDSPLSAEDESPGEGTGGSSSGGPEQETGSENESAGSSSGSEVEIVGIKAGGHRVAVAEKPSPHQVLLVFQKLQEELARERAKVKQEREDLDMDDEASSVAEEESAVRPMNQILAWKLQRGAQNYDPAITPAALELQKHLLTVLPISRLKLCHADISPFFLQDPHRGRPVEGLVAALEAGTADAMQITPLVVMKLQNDLWTVMGNRRLYAYKEFQKRTSAIVKTRAIVYDLSESDQVPPCLIAKFLNASSTETYGQSVNIRQVHRR